MLLENPLQKSIPCSSHWPLSILEYTWLAGNKTDISFGTNMGGMDAAKMVTNTTQQNRPVS